MNESVATALINNAGALDKLGTIGILIFLCAILLYLLKDKGKLEQTLKELSDIQKKQLDLAEIWAESFKQREQIIFQHLSDKLDNAEEMLSYVKDCCKENQVRIKYGRRKEDTKE